MDKYKKGKNVEEPLTEESIPISNLPENFLWMRVRGGTKIYHVLGPALEHINRPEGGHVVWTGYGPAVKKTISCAELTKQKISRKLHQITRLAWLGCDEHWEPLVDGLDELVVRRRVPVVHILLSTEPLDPQQPGYQPPGNAYPFRKEIEALNKTTNRTHGQRKSTKTSFK